MPAADPGGTASPPRAPRRRPAARTAPSSAPVRRGRRVPAAPLVSIVICVTDRVGDLARCLTSLAALPSEPSHEVVVVANGTPEPLLDGLPHGDRLVLVPSPVNLGFGGGCNWGARFARGRHLVFLNDDTEVEREWLRALVEAAGADPRIGAAGSLLLDPDGTVQEAGAILWRDGGTHPVGRGLASLPPALARLRDVDYCSACGLLVTRTAWTAVGGFDERYFPAYHEDVDLCLRLREQGHRVVIAPAARVRHRRGGSLPDGLRDLVGARSGRSFLERWGPALAGFEPHPEPAALEAGVAAAIRRAEGRPLPPPPAASDAVPEAVPLPSPPSAEEALRVQTRALRRAEELNRELIERMREDLGREAAMLREELRRERARLDALQRLVERLHIPPAVVGWARRRTRL